MSGAAWLCMICQTFVSCNIAFKPSRHFCIRHALHTISIAQLRLTAVVYAALSDFNAYDVPGPLRRTRKLLSLSPCILPVFLLMKSFLAFVQAF